MKAITLDNIETLLSLIEQTSKHKDPYLIAIAGCPGAGKSTLSEKIKDQIPATKVVQMDGFHLSNDILEQRGLLAKKGSPETFDLGGFQALLSRLKNRQADTDEVIYAPRFERQLDSSIGSAVPIYPVDKCIIVEGNYLLLDEAGWSKLKSLFDLTIFIDVSEEELLSRLTKRWLDLGLNQQSARARVEKNDALNIQRVLAHSQLADIQLKLD